MTASQVLKHRVLKSIVNDTKKYAEAVKLKYVSDSEPGIKRVKNGKGFYFTYNNKKLNSSEDLQRIKSLVIPPAWENVWICKDAEGHIQCTGYDVLKRKQYRYHPLWSSMRKETNFLRMVEFGESLPQLRLKLEKDLSQKDLTESKVLAAVISLMEKTYIRVGSAAYEKLYGSHGLTTLKDQHVKINGHHLTFAFKGKKRVQQNISIRNSRLARIVKQCRDIPGKELFQFKADDGTYKVIESGKVNAYIKESTGKEFTAKDFRTWAGTLSALQAFRKSGLAETKKDTKRKVIEALDYVSSQLGNTRAVCKKHYVHPVIIELYENKNLQPYLRKLDKMERSANGSALAAEEQVVMTILKAAGSASRKN